MNEPVDPVQCRVNMFGLSWQPCGAPRQFARGPANEAGMTDARSRKSPPAAEAAPPAPNGAHGVAAADGAHAIETAAAGVRSAAPDAAEQARDASAALHRIA